MSTERPDGGGASGRFRLAQWGDGELFIEYSTPPYIVLFAKSKYVVVGFEDVQETKRLFEVIGEHTETRHAAAY